MRPSFDSLVERVLARSRRLQTLATRKIVDLIEALFELADLVEVSL